VLAHDVTDRLAAEHKLRESEAGLYRAQVLAKLGHVITGPGGAFESWSENLSQLVGIEPDRMPRNAREWLDNLHPDDCESFRAKMIEAGARGRRVEVEYRLRRADGAWIDIRHFIEPLPQKGDAKDPKRWFSTLQDVTEHKQAENALRVAETNYRSIFENAVEGIYRVDSAGRVVAANPALARILGYDSIDAMLAGIKHIAKEVYVDPGARKEFRRLMREHETVTAFETRWRRKDGTIIWVSLSGRMVADPVTGVPYHLGAAEDITARKKAEKKIRRLNRVYAVLSQINSLIVRVSDRDELFREACRIAIEQGRFRMAWVGVLDRTAEVVKPAASAGEIGDFFETAALAIVETKPGGYGLAGRAVRELKPVISNDVHNDKQRLMRKELEERGINSLAVIPLIVSGEAAGVIALYSSEVGFFDEQEMRLLLELAGNISLALEHIAKTEQLDYLAYYDELTGLANRKLFLERAEQKLIAARNAKHKASLLVFDLERFKTVNDALGRRAGDELLKQIADRMTQVGSDATRIARVGADQFAIISLDLENENEGQLARLVERRYDIVFGQPFNLGGKQTRASAKVGIAAFPSDGADAETLFRNAEAALKKAKSTGERYLFYTQQMTERVAGKFALENKLRQALENDEFVLHYQPKVSLETRSVVGVEALIRWQSPDGKLVPPLHFIPLLEETGLILQVGSWALNRAARDHRAWTERGLKPPRVAVNVSAIQLRQRDFVGVVEQAIIDGVAPTGIDLEITESLVMEDVQGNIEKLKAVRALGVKIAIDDFGTGYSSLGYLAKLPVQFLKIDRSFIITMQSDPNAMTLVSTMISLAHSLHLKVIAEGVETEEQAKFLRLLRCDEMQGYLFSKPLPADQLVTLLQARLLEAVAEA